MDRIRLDIDEMESGRIRVIIYVDGEEVGVMYYELAKRGFVNKPVGMNKWACVDAKIVDLYDRVKDITPRDIMELCQDEIQKSFLRER